ncbi:MAG TPA: class I SAM-dependent methyltransferase [Ktedonobacterales bacterium]
MPDSSASHSSALPGVHPAPNIQRAPDVYEIENQAVDPEQLIEQAMERIAPWRGKVVVDLGAGTGFHLPRFAERAAHVVGVEPHGPSRLRAMARCSALGLENVSIMTGSAEQVWLPDASVDMMHARFAYFFGPGCEPGLRELQRILRPDGTAFIIDNNLRHGTFAAWLRRVPHFATLDPDALDRFWREQGFDCEEIASEWRFERRADLEAVVRNEFPGALAGQLLAEHEGLSVAYVYNLYYKRY